MAIYHLNAKVGSRSSGQSAAAKFAYICREGRYADGKKTRVDKEELVHAESGNMPAWAEKNPALYWQSADLYERANGRLFQQVEIALPVELSGEKQIQLAQEFALALSATEAGPLPYSFAIHRGKGENPHAHIIVSERVGDGHDRAPETWFKRAADTKKQTPELGGAKKSAAFQPREWLGEVRELWAARANDALKLAGKEERIDHRSYAARGIEQIPTVHEGPNVRQLVKDERLATDRIALTSEIREVNDKLAGELAEIRTQSDLAQKQLDVLMEEIERGAMKAQEQAAKERAAEAAIRAKREADREAFKAEAARKVEEAKLIEPATTANAALVAIANRIEQRGTERVLVSRQEAAIFADAMAGVGLPGRLHGQGRGADLLKVFEDGGRLPIGETRRQNFKERANIEVSRTAKGFEYAITAIKDKVTEFVAYLRGAAANQLDWDTKVLKSRSKQIEQSQSHQRKDNSLGR
jgi:MobA/MobL family